jgi:hypothetical protein
VLRWCIPESSVVSHSGYCTIFTKGNATVADKPTLTARIPSRALHLSMVDSLSNSVKACTGLFGLLMAVDANSTQFGELSLCLRPSSSTQPRPLSETRLRDLKASSNIRGGVSPGRQKHAAQTIIATFGPERWGIHGAWNASAFMLDICTGVPRFFHQVADVLICWNT